MNRKHRRAALSMTPALQDPGDASGRLDRLMAEALRFESNGQPEQAARTYRQILQIAPDHAQALNNLGCLLQARGDVAGASTCFARAFSAMPQLFDQYAAIYATLRSLLPPIIPALAKAADNWPQRLIISELFDPGDLATIAANPLFRCILESAPVRDLAFERLLTNLRASLLDRAVREEATDDAMLALTCALARQCFINEYVFASTPEEDARIERLSAVLGEAAARGGAIAPIEIVALAMYRPLYDLSFAPALLQRAWPRAVDDMLTQQLREPERERLARAEIARLTPIEDATSQRVRRQYEDNPYPRWVRPAGQIVPVTVDRYLRDLFPTAPFVAMGDKRPLDILVAGCGTGWQAIGVTQVFLGARVLAVDLSLSSLAYARERTPADLRERIDYAQADILALGELGRRFDIVDASGVLHHMADPMQGWRALLGLLRSDGLMHLGLYSELGRRDVVAGRQFIAERGYAATPADIRRCRQDIVETPLRGLTRFGDFFTMSECRDLLFHVSEARVTIPQIKAFLAEHGLRFLGFEFDAATQQQMRGRFTDAGWRLSDLDRWHELEINEPDIFSGMYHFWVQKS